VTPGRGNRQRPRSPGIDPLELRADAPLLDAYLHALEAKRRPFTIPGHKGRADLVGAVVAGDVPLYGGLDAPKLTAGVLPDAEHRAARLWGADVARFSVGGSTHGNQALALAVAAPDQPVVVSRTLHRSLLLGLVLAGLKPVWVRPDVDGSTGLPGAVPVAAVAEALERHPGARAVFVGDPSYVGTTSDVAGLAAVTHAHGIPLLVDAAWGGHFGFHPALPRHALARGADAVVTSAHKMLTAYSQGALVLARTALIDPGRLDRAFEATHTTSPAGAILASIDAARALLQHHGERLLARSLELVAAARARLGRIEGLVVADLPGMDPLRLILLLAGTGASGLDVERDLLADGIALEMADRDMLVPIVTMADDGASLDGLLDALERSIARRRGAPRRAVASAAWSIDPRPVLPPRDAFFAPREAVPMERAAGRVAAELVAPYPPGIPVLAPGEEVTRTALEALRRARDDGVRIAYAADPTLRTLEVLTANPVGGGRAALGRAKEPGHEP
jgi:arginine decarboxylase